jgi:1-acyl-sn-glycerol-3-phosphate acyltransferase
VHFGEPIRWDRIEAPTRDQQQYVAEAIFAEIKKLYGALEADGGQAEAAGPRCEAHAA